MAAWARASKLRLLLALALGWALQGAILSWALQGSGARGQAFVGGAGRAPAAAVARPAAVARRRQQRLRPASRRASEPASSDPAAAGFDGFVDDKLVWLKAGVESEPGKSVAGLFGEERFESVKTSVVAILFAVVPQAVTGWLDPERLTPRWEFQLDMLALQVFLFGLVYRYAVREGDDNPMQRMGVLAAFVLPRALFLVEIPPECTPAPLNCGEPLGYFSWPMLAQVAKHLATGGITLGAALYGLERAFAVGLVRRFKGGS